MSVLELYEPLNSPIKVDNNIWIVNGSITKMAVGPIKVPFTTRMTIIKLNNEDLFLHSPIEPTEKLIEQVNSIGKVKHLISPNKIHYAHIQSWKQYYPDATAWASPGVKERARSQKIYVDFDEDLTPTPPTYWSNEIDQIFFRGSRYMEEVVFFHRAGHVLILTDLIENFELQKVKSLLFRLLLRIAGNYHPVGKAPIDLRATFFGGKKEASKSLQEILSWKPEKIIISHGKCIFENAQDHLIKSFSWLDN